MRTYMLAAAIAAASVCALGAQTVPAAASVKVDRIATAAGVEDREPVNESASFGRTAGRVYTWTKISAGRTPVSIRHVYYADGKKAAEVELSINGSPYRVWSYKTVWPGDWKVDVTDESGTVLASAEFTVSASAAPAETERPAAFGK